MRVRTVCSRRELLAFGSIFAWLPFFRPHHLDLAGSRLRIIRNGRPRRKYILIHGDEATAREVLASHIRWHEGIAYAAESKSRNVPVGSGWIDPNRMFSEAGAAASLKNLNPVWTSQQIQAALQLLRRHRQKLLHALLPQHGRLTVALHNNSEAYSVADEKAASDAMSLRDPANPHAFFLCTNQADFQRLSTSAYNVVLQHSQPETDDGSLSRAAAAHGARYVNLEVRRGEADRQQEMLDWMEWVLP